MVTARLKIRRSVLLRVARYGAGFGLAGLVLGVGSLSWLPLVSVVGLALVVLYGAIHFNPGRRTRP